MIEAGTRSAGEPLVPELAGAETGAELTGADALAGAPPLLDPPPPAGVLDLLDDEQADSDSAPAVSAATMGTTARRRADTVILLER